VQKLNGRHVSAICSPLGLALGLAMMLGVGCAPTRAMVAQRTFAAAARTADAGGLPATAWAEVATATVEGSPQETRVLSQGQQTATAFMATRARRPTVRVVVTRAASSEPSSLTPQSEMTEASPPLHGCQTLDFEIVNSPAITLTDVTNGKVELSWRVRNSAATAECLWGDAGHETDALRAREVTGVITEAQYVRLAGGAGNEYGLMIGTQLPAGRYTLRWRLGIAGTGIEGGPELIVPVSIVPPSPTPVEAPVPTRTPIRRAAPTAVATAVASATPWPETVTPCPTEVYDCRCKEKCHTDSATGRTVCTKSCDRCTRISCN
jgi:hypothetical protein